MTDRVPNLLATILVGLATGIVIVSLSVLPFLTPQWVSFEQGRADATSWTGFTRGELDQATGAILSDLVFGPPAFDVAVRGQPVLDERERGHMRDVRAVFLGLWILTLGSIVGLAVAFRRLARTTFWRGVRGGASVLAVGVVAAGIMSIVAFDTVFAVFHELLFPGGTYTFDPATERLVQLFPFAFWQETALVVGAVVLVLAAVVAIAADRRVRRRVLASVDGRAARAPVAEAPR
ncbi:MAG: DUF1461 domain-containing protein [Chloroflexota bacterium]